MRFIGISVLVAAAFGAPLASAQDTNGNWPAYNRTYSSERFSPLADISPSNVAQLRPLCSYDTGETTSFQTGPIVVDGTMYITTDQNTYAIDAGNCELLWKNAHPYAPPSALQVNRGAAYLDGKLFRGAGDGHVFAIDARTGRTLWDVAIADPKRGESVPAAPIAWEGKVFIGNAGGDNFGVTGRMYALDARSGREIWRFDMVPIGQDNAVASRSSSATTSGSGSSIPAEKRAEET